MSLEIDNAAPQKDYRTAPPEGDDQRSGMRLALLIRTAKIICPTGEYLCIIRDVSAQGVKLKLFHPLPFGVPLWLEQANGERFAMECVWTREEEAGFRFNEPIDIKGFIAEQSHHPKRPLRLRLTSGATIVSKGQIYEATIRNLSRQGALIETLAPLAIGQKITLAGDGLPEVNATVRWRRTPFYGLALGHIFSFRELAETVGRMQSGGDHPSAPPPPWTQRRA